MKFGDKVEVVWVDIVSESAWLPIEDIKKRPPAYVTTVGYFCNYDDCLRIIHSMDSTDKEGDYTVIPRGCVKKIIPIGEKQCKE